MRRRRLPAASTNSVPPVTGHLGDLVLNLTRDGGEIIVSYVPASRFWPMQFITGGFYLDRGKRAWRGDLAAETADHMTLTHSRKGTDMDVRFDSDGYPHRGHVRAGAGAGGGGPC